RFAGRTVDCIDGNVVLASGKYPLAVAFYRGGVAIAHIDEVAAGVDMNRACLLQSADMIRLRKRRPHEQRIRRELALAFEPIDMQLALAFNGDKNQRQRGMKIEMPRTKTQAVARLHRRTVAENPGLETIHFQRAWVLRPSRRRIVAPRDQDCAAIARCHDDLM